MALSQVIFNTHDMILLFTLYQCVLYAGFIFTLNLEEPFYKNVFLALFFLMHAAIPLDILISFGEAFRNLALKNSPGLFYVFGVAYWLEGPLLYWYTRSSLYADFKFKRRDFIYLIPFFIYVIYELFFYYSLSFVEKQHLQENYHLTTAPAYMNYVTLFRELFRAYFGYLCLRALNAHAALLQNNFSDIQRLDFSWLKLLVWGFLALRLWAVVVVVTMLLSTSFELPVNFAAMGLFGNYSTFVLISLAIMFTMKYSWINSCKSNPIFASQLETQQNQLYVTDVRRFGEYIEEYKPYLTRSLTMAQLSDCMGMAPSTISAILKHHFGKSFFDFINAHRIEEAKRRLEKLANTPQDKSSILDVMYDSGFNSKASFNTQFKKEVGMTPSEYRVSCRSAKYWKEQAGGTVIN